MSNYISEVLDAGLMGPLFKVKHPFLPLNVLFSNKLNEEDLWLFFSVLFQVTLEESPDESFCNVSAQECWEMVLQRVKDTCTSLGLPTSPRFEGINGLQMFGFLSPSIVEVKNTSNLLHSKTNQ